MVKAFLLPYETQAFGDHEAEAYGRIRADLERKGTPVGPNDLIVAATVAANQGTLVTHNDRESRGVPGLRVENWTK